MATELSISNNFSKAETLSFYAKQDDEKCAYPINKGRLDKGNIFNESSSVQQISLERVCVL